MVIHLTLEFQTAPYITSTIPVLFLLNFPRGMESWSVEYWACLELLD